MCDLSGPRSKRVVPMCPQLDEILRAYLFGPRLDRGGRLLFPSFMTGAEAMVVDVRKLAIESERGSVGRQASWERACFATPGPRLGSRRSTMALR